MYDPALPADHSPLSSAEMRAQLTGLQANIDATASVNAAEIDEVSTLPPGGDATAGVSVAGGTLHFTFGIPRGEGGDPGPVGEVSAQQLSDALQTTSSNCNSVTPMESSFVDPDMDSLREKLNELINALRRDP